MSDSTLRTFTVEEVAKHNTETDCWIIVDGQVYDVTKFLRFHPGGKSVITDVAGKDATQVFYEQHRVSVLEKYDKFRIGSIAGTKSIYPPWPKIGSMSAVPFAESSYWQGYKSAYFNDSHVAFRKAVRTFLETDIFPEGPSHEESGDEPSVDLWRKMGAAGYLASRIGPGSYFKYVPDLKLPGGLEPAKMDYFHEMIAHEELSRSGWPGFNDGLGAGLVIGLPPVIHFGTEATKKDVVPKVLSGDKRICLAITEAFAGSDVANIRTTAKKSADGQHYIVNGTKKWITNGTFSDYFVTAVRTGGPGIAGISLLLIERSAGVETKKIKTSYSGAAGTAFITFDNVKVPVTNLLGKENRGFECIMYNFNHERWLIIAGVNRGSREIISDCFKWAMQRRVFGKRLIDQPVIRLKLAEMVAQLESVQSWFENLTYQMTKMSYNEQSQKLAGPIALCKYQSTRVATLISDHAVQIFGGRGITRTGMGNRVEHFQRTFKFGAVLGGSEEIMADLGMKQAIKYYPPHARL